MYWGAALRRTGRAGKGADRAPAGTGGEAETAERLAPRLSEPGREDHSDGGADDAAEDCVASLAHAATIAARGYFVNTRLPSATSTLTVSPSTNRPRSSALDSGFSTSRWMARFIGRAP